MLAYFSTVSYRWRYSECIAAVAFLDNYPALASLICLSFCIFSISPGYLILISYLELVDG